MSDASDEVRNKIIPNLTKTAKKQYDEIQKEVKKITKKDLKDYKERVENELKDLFRKKN